MKFRYVGTPTGHRRGSIVLVMTIIAAMISAGVAFSLAKFHTATMNILETSKINIEAQQYGLAKAKLLRSTNYDDVISQNKTVVKNSNGFTDEVVVGAETDYSDKVKQKVCTINVYKDGEKIPRFSYKISKLSTGNIVLGTGSSTPESGGSGSGASSSNIQTNVLSGTIVDSGTLPVPNGYTREQCTYMYQIKKIVSSTNSGLDFLNVVSVETTNSWVEFDEKTGELKSYAVGSKKNGEKTKTYYPFISPLDEKFCQRHAYISYICVASK